MAQSARRWCDSSDSSSDSNHGNDNDLNDGHSDDQNDNHKDDKNDDHIDDRKDGDGMFYDHAKGGDGVVMITLMVVTV